MKREYGFYGALTADCPPVEEKYAKIKDPRVLYDLLLGLWCEYTCAPRMRKDYQKSHKSLGQCSITAFLAQDIFGGEVYGVPLKDGGFHCFNKVGEIVFDLTNEQFGDEVLEYTLDYPQQRAVHFQKQEKRERYEYLRKELEKLLQEK